MEIKPENKEPLDAVFRRNGYTDYRWIDPRKICVAQWVRTKCMFGCRAYGNCAACPPNVPSIPECERFFSEYREGVIFHFEKRVAQPADRHKWSQKVNLKLLALEREVFISGYERAFVLFMDNCSLCKECAARREECREPMKSRPSPEGFGVDVYSTVRQFGFTINVRSDYSQKMDRYAFLMVR